MTHGIIFLWLFAGFLFLTGAYLISMNYYHWIYPWLARKKGSSPEGGFSLRPTSANSTSERSPFRLRLTLRDCSAYSPFSDPTLNFRARPPSQLLCSCTCNRPLCGGNGVVEDRFRLMARGNFGERLKRERELREVSMDELTKATRISTRFVEAL